jgi:sarcosine oxidase subunit alpha
MRVGGEPDVTTCVTRPEPGITVERQNVLGSGDVDVLQAVDFLYREGLDHHHLMTRFKLLNEAAKAVARRLAGIGEVPSSRPNPPTHVRRHEGLVVIGAGPAGLAAGAAAAKAGVRPLVIEARERIGGWASECFSQDGQATPEHLARLEAEIAQGGDILLGARAVGIYDEGGEHTLVVRSRSELFQITCQRVVVATGGFERPLVFEANDLPGVFAGRGLVRLIRETGVTAWKCAVVVGAQSDAGAVAKALEAAGIAVVALIDTATDQPIRASGRQHVTGLRVRSAGEERPLACDAVALVAPRAPAYELAAELGLEAVLDEESGGFVIKADREGRTALEWVVVAGTVAGRGHESVDSGTRAGHAAATGLAVRNV